MESLYLLIPLSLLLVRGIGAVLVWSVLGGQFEDLEAEGNRILADDTAAVPAIAAAVSDTAETSGADPPPGSGRD